MSGQRFTIRSSRAREQVAKGPSSPHAGSARTLRRSLGAKAGIAAESLGLEDGGVFGDGVQNLRSNAHVDRTREALQEVGSEGGGGP